MDFGALGENVPLLLLIVGLILVQFFFMRKRKPEVTRQEITQSLLSEVKLNLALVETSNLRPKPKKFETVSWQRNKNKLEFLDKSLQSVLSNAFMLVEDFNQQIDSSKKYKSASYVINVDVGKLKGPLTKSREGLEEWFQTKAGSKEPPPKYPGIFDSFFGGR